MKDHEHWARIAAQWVTWARASKHDSFWAYRDELARFIGRGPGEALEVGCGEGRISRLLKACGWRVTASDPVEALVRAAEQAGSADSYRVAEAGELPFADRSFDLVVVYNVLMDIEDIAAAIKEMNRVLRRSGTMLISIVHPFADRGRFAGPEPDAPFIVEKSYFERERFDGVEERDGLTMHFAGWSQPLEHYAKALEREGLAITALREPVPDPAAVLADDMTRWGRIPLFLWLKARPIAT